MINLSITATEFRNRCFELLNLVSRGSEFVIEKDGRPAARLVPYTPLVSAERVKKILLNFRSAFSNTKGNDPWSVLETEEWKKKEKKYLKDLSNKS